MLTSPNAAQTRRRADRLDQGWFYKIVRCATCRPWRRSYQETLFLLLRRGVLLPLALLQKERE
jgi:hypothetical protein